MTVIDTYLLLRAFCDELARCGMRHACTSPGSRCTPIVLSLASEPRLRCWSHVDERCAGFFALGAAGGGHLHVGHGGGQPGARRDRGPVGGRAAAGADRRSPPRAARGGGGADDRSAQALRRRRPVVLRGGGGHRHTRAPALDAHARLPRLLDRARRFPGGRAPELSPARAARARRTAARRPHRPPGRPTLRPGAPGGARPVGGRCEPLAEPRIARTGCGALVAACGDAAAGYGLALAGCGVATWRGILG